MNFLEKIYRVYDPNEPFVFIEVHPYPDAPQDAIEVHTSGSLKSEEFYGKQSIVLGNKEQALALAEAIKECAEQLTT